MLLRKLAATCGVLALATATALAGAPKTQIQGDYLEARTADIYTGPCFSNAEVFITGHQAVVAWKINKGSWNDVDLGGLCVAAAIKGDSTFSQDQPENAQSIILVDRRATAKQREALISLAKNLAGKRLDHVVSVVDSTLTLTIERHSMTDADSMPAEHSYHNTPHAPRALFWAPGLATIETRPLDERDHTCGNEVLAYPPLSSNVTGAPAYTLGHRFKGEGLNTTWNDPNCRSSLVGSFSR